MIYSVDTGNNGIENYIRGLIQDFEGGELLCWMQGNHKIRFIFVGKAISEPLTEEGG